MDREFIRQQANLELARRDFWHFCRLMAPDFYQPNRGYLKTICQELQDFYFSKDTVLLINAPPRHGKSRTAGLFAQWVFGRNQDEKIMTGSYNETLSTTFSKSVRSSIQAEKVEPDILVYRDIFPEVKIKYGDAAMNLWSLEGRHASYLATSPSGTATGFGASLLLIDDLIKNAEEAFNESVLEKQWNWFTDTMLSRLEEGGKIIIIMTRWASRDLAGRAKEHFAQLKIRCKELVLKAVQPDGSMLCDEILSRNSYEMKALSMSEEIASANYQQIPMDLQGRLYKAFKTYDKVPTDNEGNTLLEGIYSYTDTADEGGDYLCSFVFGIYQKEAYILDAVYTKAGMEVTEGQVAKLFAENEVNLARIESNNGGKSFARNVLRNLTEELKNTKTVVKWFHQSKNKQARILSNSSWVMQHLYFPVNWRHRWPDLFRDLTGYQKEGKNKHDDAPDALTGVAETVYLITGA